MAKAKLKVLMLQRVAWVWKEWDIIEVSYSQAKNYLIPKNLAREVTQDEVQIIKKKESEKSKNTREIMHSRHIIWEKLHWKEFVFEEKWQSWKMFWWVSEKDIIDRINKEFKISLDKKNIILPEWHHLKKEWEYDVKLNLWSDIYSKILIKLKIVD